MVKNRAFGSGYDTLCLVCNRRRVKEYRKAGKRNSAKESKLYYARYPEKGKARQAKYRKENPEKAKSIVTASRHSRRNRNVLWEKELTIFATKEASLLAQHREKLTGIKWHVDHVIPLKGKQVSGLHIWNNLQVIPAIENLRKTNSFATGY